VKKAGIIKCKMQGGEWQICKERPESTNSYPEYLSALLCYCAIIKHNYLDDEIRMSSVRYMKK